MSLSSLRAWFSRLLLNPWFAGITTVTGVVAGWLGAHFDHEITASFPFRPPGSELSGGALLFWATTFLFGVCFAGTLREQAKAAEHTSRELAASTGRIETQTGAIVVAAADLGRHVGDIEARTHALAGVAGQIDQKTGAVQAQTANLERLVQRLHTLPPIGFLQEYAVSGQLLVELAYRAGPETSLDALESLVRAQLVCILKIVSVFDERGSQARYGCNLMLHRDAAGLAPHERAAIQARLHFVEDGVQVSGLDSVLDVQPALSVSSESDARPDPRLTPMALPVPRLAPGVDPLESQVLPGAPYTFLSGEASVFEVATDLDRLVADGRFSRFLVNRLKAFFTSPDSAIRSFACFPVYAPDLAIAGPNTRPTDDRIPIAVLSIHRDSGNPSAAERLALLNPLMTPLCAGLGTLLQTLADRAMLD